MAAEAVRGEAQDRGAVGETARGVAAVNVFVQSAERWRHTSGVSPAIP